eukprot:134844_1
MSNQHFVNIEHDSPTHVSSQSTNTTVTSKILDKLHLTSKSISPIDEEINESLLPTSNDKENIEMTFKMDESIESDSSQSKLRLIHENTSTSHVFWNLCKGFVGAASFSLPWAVSKTGLIPSILGFIFLAYLCKITFRWLLLASHFSLTNQMPTYPELGQIAFSKWFNVDRYGYQMDAKNIQDNINAYDSKILLNNQDENDIDDIPMKIIGQSLKNNSHSNEREQIKIRYTKYNQYIGCIAKYSIWFAMFFGLLGGCGSYILFISGVLYDGLILLQLSHIFTPKLTVLFMLPIPLILVLIRSYKILSKTAQLGVIGVALALLITIIDGCFKISRGDIDSSNIVWFNISGFPIFVGNACFLFVIHVMVLSQEQSMGDRTRFQISKQFEIASSRALTTITVINMIFSVFGFVSFSKTMNSPQNDGNIVSLLDHGGIQIFTKIFLCIDLLFTYAIIMYPFTEALDAVLFTLEQLKTKKVKLITSSIRVFIVLCTAMIAIYIPHFGYLTGLTGGSAAVFLGFVLPPLFVWKLAPHKLTVFERKFLIWFVLLFGLAMMILSPYLILSEMYG